MRRIVWLGSATAAVADRTCRRDRLRGTAPPEPTRRHRPLRRQRRSRRPPHQSRARRAGHGAQLRYRQGRPAGPRRDCRPRRCPATRCACSTATSRSARSPPMRAANGCWCRSAPIAPGNRQLGLEATGRDGGPGPPLGRCRGAVGDAARRGRPRAVEPRRAAPGRCDQPARVLQQPTRRRRASLLSLDTAEYGAHRRLMLSGHAAPGARLNVYAGRSAARHGHGGRGRQMVAHRAAPATGGRRRAAPRRTRRRRHRRAPRRRTVRAAERAAALAAGGSYVVQPRQQFVADRPPASTARACATPPSTAPTAARSATRT